MLVKASRTDRQQHAGRRRLRLFLYFLIGLYLVALLLLYVAFPAVGEHLALVCSQLLSVSLRLLPLPLWALAMTASLFWLGTMRWLWG